jgi:sigma-B regulation protein RsbU (phosphoserine phosphatase)
MEFSKNTPDQISPKPAGQGIREKLRMAMKIVEQSPVILFRRMPEPDTQLVYVSENISRFGYAAEDFLEKRILFRDLVHPDDRDRIRAEIEEYAAHDVSDYTQNYRLVTRGGEVRWLEDTTTTERNDHGKIVYYQGTVVDVTERKLAEEALSKSEAKFRRIVETSAEGFLMMDSDFRIVDVNDAFCRMLGYSRSELIGQTAYDLATPEFKIYLQASAQELLGQKYRTFEGLFNSKSGRNVPVLIHRNALIDDSGESMGQVAFVTDLTDQKKSLVLAGEVQKSLLPKSPPHITGLDIAGLSVPCEEIGGDYFDYLQPAATSPPAPWILTVAVGDIAGHGVDSALLMATARAVLRDRYRSSESLSKIVNDLNRALVTDFMTTHQFMTLFALEIGRRHNSIRWVRAGHDPALLYRPDSDRFMELEGPGMVLGVAGDVLFRESVMNDVPPGAIIALGTDGIWEAFNPAGEMFGKSRFREIIRRYADQSASTILDHVYKEVHSFTEGHRSQDDITLVILKIVPV